MWRVFRLIALMLVGAMLGSLPEVGHLTTVAEKRFVNTVLGSFCGLGIETLIRAADKR
jgi:hypothetical protein